MSSPSLPHPAPAHKAGIACYLDLRRINVGHNAARAIARLYVASAPAPEQPALCITIRDGAARGIIPPSLTQP